mgnify:CR=1 FL=1
MINVLWKHRIIIFIIFLSTYAILLRFHNLSNSYIFGFDEEYYATYAWTLVSDPHPIWIGGSASFLDYYLGPYFTYFTAFLLWISRGDPLFTGYIAGIVGTITSIAIFFVGWRFFNLTTGIAASLLYAGLPMTVFYDQKYWNPMFVPIIVLVIFTSLMLVKKSPWWWLLFTGAVGAIFNTDLAPLPLSLIGIIYFIKGKYWLNKKIVLSCTLVFLLFYWPLLVFDYNHNFSNLTVLSRYKKQVKQSGAKFDPKGKYLSFLNTMGRYWYLREGRPNADELNISCNSQKTSPSPWLSSLSIILFLSFLTVSFMSKKEAYKILSYFLVVSFGFYVIYTGGAFEYYLLMFITLFTFIPAILIGHLNVKLKPFFWILILIILALGFNTVFNSSDKFGLGAKKRLIEKVMGEVGNNNFSIEDMGVCHTYEGWRFLFKAYGKTPTKSFTDKHLAWMYPKEVKNDIITYEVFLSQWGVIPDKNMIGYTKIEEGGFSAYVKKIK